MSVLHTTLVPLVYLMAAVAVILGLRMLPRVRTARRGLVLAAAGVVAALAVTVADSGFVEVGPSAAGALAGAVAGALVVIAPSGGAFARLRSALEGGGHALWAGLAAVAAGLLGLSLLRSDRAASLSVGLPGAAAVVGGVAALGMVALALRAGRRSSPAAAPWSALAVTAAGLAEAGLGFALGNVMLILLGGLLATLGVAIARRLAAGLAMPLRSLLSGRGSGDVPVRVCDTEEAALALEGARQVAIVPGYGMAVAQAQHAVHELAELLARQGAEVRFVVHPWAGRIPGHMNVLLDEVNVPHEILHEPAASAGFLATADAVIVVGANDVVNPAIEGLPALDLSGAGVVLLIDRAAGPGSSGVPNPLFRQPNAMLLPGDAKKLTQGLVAELKPHHA